MSIGEELGQYILKTHNSKKNSEDSMGGWTPYNLPCGYASGHCCEPQPSIIIIIVIIIVIGHYLSIYLSRKHKTYGNHIREQDS